MSLTAAVTLRHGHAKFLTVSEILLQAIFCHKTVTTTILKPVSQRDIGAVF